jgi:hypothetical protein
MLELRIRSHHEDTKFTKKHEEERKLMLDEWVWMRMATDVRVLCSAPTIEGQ